MLLFFQNAPHYNILTLFQRGYGGKPQDGCSCSLKHSVLLPVSNKLVVDVKASLWFFMGGKKKKVVWYLIFTLWLCHKIKQPSKIVLRLLGKAIGKWLKMCRVRHTPPACSYSRSHTLKSPQRQICFSRSWTFVLLAGERGVCIQWGTTRRLIQTPPPTPIPHPPSVPFCLDFLKKLWVATSHSKVMSCQCDWSKPVVLNLMGILDPLCRLLIDTKDPDRWGRNSIETTETWF